MPRAKIATLMCGAMTRAVPARDRAGLDRVEPPHAGLEVGDGAAEAVEGGVERLVLLVVGMVVAAVGVGLPDLDQGIAHQVSVPSKISPSSRMRSPLRLGSARTFQPLPQGDVDARPAGASCRYAGRARRSATRSRSAWPQLPAACSRTASGAGRAGRCRSGRRSCPRGWSRRGPASRPAARAPRRRGSSGRSGSSAGADRPRSRAG